MDVLGQRLSIRKMATGNLSVGIVGGGIAGRLSAWFATEKKWHVTLFDENALNAETNCSWIAAGLLSPYAELAQTETEVFLLGQRSIPLWKKIFHDLTSVFWQQKGSVLLAHRQDETDLEHLKNLLQKRLPTSGGIKCLDRVALKHMEPNLPHYFQNALYFPEEGQLDPKQLLTRLYEVLLERGIQWHANTRVQKVGPHTIWLESGEKAIFDVVIDCRGLGARADLPNLRGVRGELVHLHAPEVILKHPIRLLHPRYAIYIAPRPNHRYVIGASSIENEDLSPASVKSVMELLSAAYTVHPSFAEARILKLGVQCRPALPDNLPYIEHIQGLLRINGLYRHGYLIAPALIKDALNTLE